MKGNVSGRSKPYIIWGVLACVLLLLSSQCFAQPKPRPLAFRGMHFFIFDVKPGDKVSVALRPVRMHEEFGLISCFVIDSKSRTLTEMEDVRSPVTVSFTVPQDGGDVAVLIVKGNRNWYMVDSLDQAYIVRDSPMQPAHVTGDTSPFYFFVPEGTKHLRVYVMCDSPYEGATVRVLRPDGTEAMKMTDQFDRPKALDIREEAGMQGVWAIQLEHPKRHGGDFSLDDVVLYFSKNIPPFISVDRSALPGLILRYPE